VTSSGEQPKETSFRAPDSRKKMGGGQVARTVCRNRNLAWNLSVHCADEVLNSQGAVIIG